MKKKVHLTENELYNIINESIKNVYESQFDNEAMKRLDIAIKYLKEYIGNDKSRALDLSVVMNQLNALKRLI